MSWFALDVRDAETSSPIYGSIHVTLVAESGKILKKENLHDMLYFEMTPTMGGAEWTWHCIRTLKALVTALEIDLARYSGSRYPEEHFRYMTADDLGL